MNQDLQMELSHPRDDGLCGVLVEFHQEGGIFLGQPLQGRSQFILVSVGFGFHGHRHHRLIEIYGFQENRMFLRAEGVTRGRLLQPHEGYNIPRPGLLQPLPVVCVHQEDPRNPLLCPQTRIIRLWPGLEDTGVNTGIGQLPPLVHHDLESESTKGFIIARSPLLSLVRTWIDALNRGDIEWRREIIHDGIQERLNSLIFQSGPAHNGNQVEGDSSLPYSFLDLFLREFLPFKVLFGEGIVRFGNDFQKFSSVFCGLRENLSRNFYFAWGGSEGLFMPYNPLKSNQIHYAFKLILGS